MIQLYSWNTALEVYSKGKDRDDIVYIQEGVWEDLAQEPRKLKGKDRRFFEIEDEVGWIWVIPRECGYEVKEGRR